MKKRFIAILLLLSATLFSGCYTGSHQLADPSAPKPASYHYQMGLSFLAERNYTSELIELTEADRLDSDNPDILYRLGVAYMGKKRFDLAEPRLLRSVMLNPKNSVARNDLGVTYLELKRWDNAIQQFTLAKNDIFYDQSDNATINLGLAYLGKGDYPKAIEQFRFVLSGNPLNPFAHLSLGRAYFAMDQPEQAITEYNKALDIYRDYGQAYYHLGIAQLKMNRRNEAKDSFKAVERIIPDTEAGRSARDYLDLLK